MNRPPANKTSSAYVQQQFDEGYPDGIDAHWWSRSRSWYIARQLRKLGLASANILEVGCGRGVAVKGLRDLGIPVDGVELASTEPLREVSQYVTTGMNAIALPESYRSAVQAILLLDVIEHLEEPGSFIRDMLAYFPSVTALLVSVPARQELWSNFDDYYGHYRRYDLGMLAGLARELGYELLASSYFFHSPYIPVRLLASRSGNRPLYFQPPRGVLQKSSHQVVSWFMRLDHYLLPGSVRGSSAFAAFRVT